MPPAAGPAPGIKAARIKHLPVNLAEAKQSAGQIMPTYLRLDFDCVCSIFVFEPQVIALEYLDRQREGGRVEAIWNECMQCEKSCTGTRPP